MTLLKKTKIIATIGPVSEKEEMLEKILLAGADCIRLNFSHGNHQEQGSKIQSIRKLEKKLQKHVAIIADIQGPKMRIGTLPKEGVLLKDGQEIMLDCSKKEFTDGIIPLPSKTFMDGTPDGSNVFLDDGVITMKIIKKSGAKFQARVLKGGVLFSNKGINVPSLAIKGSVLSPKDRADILFASKAGVDYIALSFLRDANDVKEARAFLKNPTIKLIAKIERPEALIHIDQIIDEADAIMIARGDLGIETPLWELPVRQKEIVQKVRNKMKPVIVATQMLDSMIRNPLPTRAEVSDVANAVYDSADAVMLSGETASGKNPLEAVEMMRKVLESTEKSKVYQQNVYSDEYSHSLSIARSAADIARQIQAKFIFVGTLSGKSAQVISYFRPENNIAAVTSNQKVARQLSLVWGVTPFLLTGKIAKNIEALINVPKKILQEKSLLIKGDNIVCIYDEQFKISKKAHINTVSIKSV